MDRLQVVLAVAALTTVLAVDSARAAHVGGYCDAGIPSDEALGFNWFPRGDVFCPLIADPKRDGSFVSYLRGTSSSAFGTDLGSVGVGDRLGLMRWNGPQIGEGLQFSLAANVYAQFDLNASSYDLINADYTIGLPITFRGGPVSGRVRLYHQSSHLGDEFVLRSPIQRENFAFQSVEGLLALEAGPVRVYGGGEYLFARTPGEVISRVAHGGVEVRQGGGLGGGWPLAHVRLVAALDAKSSNELDWAVSWSGRAGVEIGSAADDVHRSRRWSLLAEWYDGHSPYGQFFNDHVSYYGFGVHVGL